jgi:hypothetical protein
MTEENREGNERMLRLADIEAMVGHHGSIAATPDELVCKLAGETDPVRAREILRERREQVERLKDQQQLDELDQMAKDHRDKGDTAQDGGE